MVGDSGRRPAEVWEIIGFAGVAFGSAVYNTQVHYWVGQTVRLNRPVRSATSRLAVVVLWA